MQDCYASGPYSAPVAALEGMATTVIQNIAFNLGNKAEIRQL